MCQEITATALVLSPVRQHLYNKQLEFETSVSGISINCIVEDDSVKQYMINNRITEGTLVNLTGRPVVPLGLAMIHRQRATLVIEALRLEKADDDTMRDAPPTKKRRRNDGGAMETDGCCSEPNSSRGTDEANSNNNFDNPDVENYFYMFHGRLQHLRKSCPELEDAINQLDIQLDRLMVMYHQLELTSRDFVQHATVFQEQLKELSHNRASMPFNMDEVLLPRCTLWKS